MTVMNIENVQSKEYNYRYTIIIVRLRSTAVICDAECMLIVLASASVGYSNHTLE